MVFSIRAVLTAALTAGLLAGFCCAQDTGQSRKEKISFLRQEAKRDSQAIPGIAKYLDDSDRDVREEAVKAIVNIGTQYSLDPLIHATKDNDATVQARAVDGMVNFYLPGYITTGGLGQTFTRVGKRIKNTFSSRNDQTIDAGMPVRENVIVTIGALASGGANFDVRADAARAVGVLRGRQAVPDLEKALRSKNNDVIFESLVALQKIRDTSAGPSVEFLANDYDLRVQTTALETLGVLRTTSATPQIRNAFDRARNDKVRRAALSSLAMIASPEDHSLFLQNRGSKDAELRTAAFEGLGRLRDPQDYPVLETAFNQESDMKARLAAAFALVSEGKIDTTEFSPLRYLVNGFNLVKVSSVSDSYLEELGHRPEIRSALLPLLPTGTKAEKLGLIQILAATGKQESVQPVETLTTDQDGDVSIAAARALKMIKARLP